MFKLNKLKKVADILANISLLLNSFYPFLFALSPVPVRAETDLKSTIEYNQSTHNFHLQVNTDQKLNYQIVYKTDQQVESISGDEVADSTEFSRDVYAGTCSDKSCLPHNIQQGIFKVEVPDQNWIYSQYFNFVGSSLQIFKSEISNQFDLTDTENYFIENGQLPAEISTTPTPEAIPTETQSEITPTPSISDPTPTPQVTITPAVLGQDDTLGTITTSILPYGMSRNDLLNPTLFTDKDDYSPTEIAVITGTDFEPSTQYFLHITADNLDQTYQIISDENGNFTYSYQLDGTYRPDYQVEAKDSTGIILAVTTFTDSREVVSVKVNNTSSVTVAPNTPITVTVTVTTTGNSTDNDWTSTGYKIEGKNWNCVNTPDHTYGSNTYTESFTINAPSTYGTYDLEIRASNEDGQNNSRCDTFSGDRNKTLIDAIKVENPCGNGQINSGEECDGNNLGNYSSTDFSCNSSCKIQLIEPKVTICHSHDSQSNPYNQETPNKSADVSGHDGHNGDVWYPGIADHSWGDIIPPFYYIEGFYPGKNWTTAGQAIYNNNCNVPNSTLKIVKNLINTGGGTKSVSDFKFTRNNGVSSEFFEIDGTNEYQVSPGSYSVSELPILSNEYSVAYDQCSGTIGVGETKVCTITNTFMYCGDGFVNGNEQCDDANQDNSDSCTNTCNTARCGDGFVQGIEECDDANDDNTDECTNTCHSPVCGDGFIQSGESCDDQNLTSGDGCSSTCQTEYGSVKITKDIVPDDSTLWSFILQKNGGVGNGTTYPVNNLGDNQSYTISSLPLGTYSLWEITDSKYLTQVTCDGFGPYNQNSFMLSVTSNHTNNCTFTNTLKKGSLKIIKDAKPNDTQNFIFRVKDLSNIQIGTTELDDDNAGGRPNNHTFNNLVPSTYTVYEDAVSGWSLEDVSCTNTSGQWGFANGYLTVDVLPGEKPICTFTNIKYGEINGEKFNDKDGDNHDDGSNEPGLKDWQIFIDSNNNQQFDIGETSTLTGVHGNYSFKNLLPGNYQICEVMQSGWYATTGVVCQTTTINNDGGDIDTLKFANRQYGSITVHKFNDLNHNGSIDADEPGLSDWIIGLYSGDSCQGQVVHNGSLVTNSNGDVTFTNLLPGSYSVKEELDANSDWITTSPVCQSVFVHNGKIYNLNIGNIQLGHVAITKFNDVNGNGVFDEGETAMSGWNIHLSDIGSSMTDSNGISLFSRLFPNIYSISEDNQPGWHQTNIYCEDQSEGVKITTPGEAYGHHGNCEGWNTCKDAATCALWACHVRGYSNLVSYGEGVACNSGSVNTCHLFQYGMDYEPPVLAINSDHVDNQYVDYYWGTGCGVMGVTDIVCSNNSTPSFISERSIVSDVSGQVTVEAGKTKQCYIGNQRLEPKMNISKSNNTGGSEFSPGDTVDYTITLGFADNSINNLKVTDLLSNGFVYRLGSYHVYLNGTEVTNTVGEPQYHSPGLWDLSALGQLSPSDEVQLVYTADISTDQQAGKYADLAYASAIYGYDSNKNLLAAANPEGYVDNNFVGTEVIVNRSNQNSVSANVEHTETIEGQVLGASTELPSTGAATLWLIISSILGILGLGLIKRDKISLSMAKKVLSILILPLFLLLTSAKIVSAVNSLSVRVEEPKTPTNTKDLQLKFVALDIDGNSITAKCFKKGPNDSDFSQFGSDIALSAGGNSSHCDLSLAINDAGSYQFYVTANGLASSTVYLDYKNSTPGTPTDYRKEKINDCDFKIHFKTADDGDKTVKVELYRSTDSAFSANNDSLVHSVNIGSNQESDIYNNVPDCSKTYFYVLRAFDDAGNGSGVIGDTIIVNTIYTETQTTSSQTQGAIPVLGSNLPGENQTGNTDQLTGQDQNQDQSTGQILGSATQLGNFITRHKIISIVIALVLLAIITYVFKKTRKNKKKRRNRDY